MPKLTFFEGSTILNILKIWPGPVPDQILARFSREISELVTELVTEQVSELGRPPNDLGGSAERPRARPTSSPK